MTIKQLFYICLVFSVVRLAIWIALPWLLIYTELEPIDLGIIGGLVNMFSVFFLICLIFKVFMISELKKYLKFVIPLVVLILASLYGRQLSDWVFENFMNTDQFKKEAEVKNKDQLNAI